MTQLEIDFEYDEDFWTDEAMTFDDYAMQAMDKCFYPDSVIYPAFGLVSEAGEIADKLKKFYRDSDIDHVSCKDGVRELPAELRLDLAHEIGDVIFYCCALAGDIGYDFEEIAQLNLEKLESRQLRGKLKGSGDYR